MVSNMKFDDAVLSSYLVRNLRPLTEADPNLLARYVTALLKNDKPKQELEALCIESLLDFLGDESESFVRNLFHAFDKGTVSTCNDDYDTEIAEVASTASRVIDKATCNGDSIDGRTCLEEEKLPEPNDGIFHDQEASDDEDVDRNHKHRKRTSTSHSLDRDGDFQKGSVKECVKSGINGRPSVYNKRIPTAESLKNLSAPYREKGDLLKRVSNHDQAYAGTVRHTGENNWHPSLKGSAILRGKGLDPMFEYHNSLARGGLGPKRGALAEPWIVHEQQKTALNGLALKLPLLSLGPIDPCFGRSTPSIGNAPQSSWAGFGHFPGVKTIPLDDSLFLNPVRQGPLGLTLGPSRCPDFEERGYCLRGDLCPMEHGANRIVVEDFQSLSKFNLPFTISSGHRSTSSFSSSSTSSLSPCPSDAILHTKGTNLPMVDEPSFSKGTRANHASAEPDLYDPDQPLLNKNESSGLGSGFKRLLSSRKDGEDVEGKLAVLKRHKEQSPDERKAETFSLVGMRHGLTQEQSVLKNEKHDNDDNLADGESSTLCIEGFLNAENEAFVERYEPQIVLHVCANDLKTEESLTKIGRMKTGMGSVPKREVGLYCKGGKTHDRLIMGPDSERAQRTLYVGCIPNVNDKKELLKLHFRKFGEIVDIRVPLQGDTAFVQFSRREEAEAALKSPEAVMGNRFIRLSWAKRDSVPFSAVVRDLAAPSTWQKLNVQPQGSQGLFSEVSSMKAKRPIASLTLCEANPLTAAGKAVIPSYQMMASSSSLKRQQELELMMEELRKKQDELALKREDFRRQLDRYSKQGIGVTVGPHGDSRTISSSVDSKTQPMEVQSSSKQLILEKLEAGIDKSHKEISALSASIEKALLSADQSDTGLVKDSLKNSSGPAQSPSSTHLSQRDLKGSVGGNGVGFAGSSQWSPMSYRLDNHTTAFHVLPPFPDGLVDISAFTDHFSHFGDLLNVDIDDVSKIVKVTFHTRSAAEKAFLQGRCYRGTSLHFSWASHSQASSITAGTFSDNIATVDVINGHSGHYCSKIAVE